MRWLAMMALGPLLAGCGGAGAREQVAATATPLLRSLSNELHGFSAQLPTGWQLAEASLTPHLRDPVEILSAGTMSDLRPRDGECAHVPSGVLERVGPRDAFVTVQESFGNAGFPARPERFALPASPARTEAELCARNEPELELHWFDFSDARRRFYVLVAFGRDAPPERRQEALALLDSLRFEPGREGVHLDPDRTVFSREHGLSWQMPMPWRHYDWPQTLVRGERLALGTFELRRGPPDDNCTPRAALDAMPPDGAFIYVFEYVEPQGDVPARSGLLELGAERTYECGGLSRMARWREAGRTLQAHVYLLPRASDALEAEARSILNSIRVG